MKKLNIALLHFDIKHKETSVNKKTLLSLINEAINNNVNLIITPEMSVSGYSFESKEDVAPYSETIDGPFISKLSNIAKTNKAYIIIGLALKKESNYYNSAIIINNIGAVESVYNKIMAEFHWATRGTMNQKPVISTPWGKIGVCICSDTYYNAVCRIRKLQGCDLLVVIANWPPNTLDPIKIWSLRSLENRLPMIICNRTGVDKTLDCTKAESFILDNKGEILNKYNSSESTVFYYSYAPLTEPSKHHKYKHIEIENLINAFKDYNTKENQGIIKLRLSSKAIVQSKKNSSPMINVSATEKYEESALIENNIFFNFYNNGWFHKSMDNYKCIYKNSDILVVKYQNILIGCLNEESIQTPELVFTLSRLGCHILLCALESELSSNDLELIKSHTVHRIVIGLLFKNYSSIIFPPSGHNKWKTYLPNEKGTVEKEFKIDEVCNKKYFNAMDLDGYHEHLSESVSCTN